MKNKITNFFNHAANAPQNTGGGNSHHSMRSEGSQVFKQFWRYAACLLLAFFVGIGQMWGVEITVNRFALVESTIIPLNTSNIIWQDEVVFETEETPSLSSNCLVVSQNKKVTISAHGKTITSIVVVWNNGNNTTTADVGSITKWENSNKTMTWAGSATSVTFTSGVNTRINSAVVTYTDATPLSGISSTTLSDFSRSYGASSVYSAIASKTPSAPGVNIKGTFESDMKIKYSTTNGLNSNAVHLVSPRPISSVVYTWSTAPTSTAVSSGTYSTETSTWTAANKTTTEVTLYNRGSSKALLSTIEVIFVSNCEDLAAPATLTCSDTKTSSTLTFSWASVTNASSYDVKLWDNSTCTGDPVASDNVTTTSKTFEGLSAETTYYCKVQSKGNGTTYCTEGGITDAVSGTTEAASGYAITKSATNGTIAVTDGSDPITSAKENDDVYIAATPNTGYGFTSWDVYKTGESSTKVTLETDDDSDNKTRKFTMPAYAVTVGATFTAINYAVTHSAATNGSYTIQVGEASATDANTTANYGQTITLTATPASDAYYHSGWTVTGNVSGDPVEVTENTFTMPAEGVTVVATFAANNTITYNANDGSGSMAATVGHGAVNLRANAYTKDGYVFAGWATSQANANAGTIAYADGAAYNLTADADLYAVWYTPYYTFVPTGEASDVSIVNGVTVATSTGGTMTFTAINDDAASTLKYNAFGLQFGKNSNCAVTIALAENSIVENSIIVATIHNRDKNARGLKLCTTDNGTDVTSGAWTWTLTDNDTPTPETKVCYYTVNSSSALKNATSFRLLRNNTVYLQKLVVAKFVAPAVDYTVTINPNGGSYASTPDGWTYSAGVYSKSIASGTSFSAPDGLTKSTDELSWKDGSNNNVTFPVTISSDITFVAQWTPYVESSNANLSALSVAGCTLNETFDASTTAYTIDLPFGSSMPAVSDVTATKADTKAEDPAVSISGNVITIACEAEDGTKKNYTITVTIAATKDIRMVWKKEGNPCGESSVPADIILSTNDAVKDYLAISFVQTTETAANQAEEKSGSYLSTGKSIGNLVKITAKPGYAFKNMSFYGKIETDEIQCPVSIDGGETWTNVTGSLGSNGQHCDVFTNAEAHEIILKNNAGAGTWIRHMDLTIINACTPKTIAWTTEPAAEYEVGKSATAIAATANNGTVSYASNDGDVIAVNTSNGALTVSALGTVTLSASVPAGDGTTYCDEGASVNKASINTYYLVTFDPQNGESATLVKYYKNGAAIALPSTPSWSGYTFQGWFDAETGGNAVTSAVTPTASRTIYAQWEAQCDGPTITAQPASANYLTGRTPVALACTATAGAAGELTYTWYSCDDALKTNPVALAGAPTPSTAAAGTFYYYCAVTEAGCDVEAFSNVVTITVADKDPVCIIKATPTTDTEATADGAYKGSAAFKSSGKKLSSKYDYVAVQLMEGKSFLATDKVVLNQTANLSGENDITKFYIFKEVPADGKTYITVNNDSPVKGDNRFTMPAGMAGESSLYIGRVNSSCNPTVGYLAVYRVMNPELVSLSVNSVAAAKGVGNAYSVTLPAGTNLASLSLTERIAWNAPAESDSKQVTTNEGAWAWGDNTYVLTDKDGDATTYTITLNQAAAIDHVTISGTLTVMEKASTTLSAAVYDTNDQVASIQDVTWSVKSGDEDYAEVSASGVVTGKAVGTAHIIATSVADPTVSAQVEVVVTAFSGTKRVYWFADSRDATKNEVSNNATVFASAPEGSSSRTRATTLETGWVINTDYYKSSTPANAGQFVVPAGYSATWYASFNPGGARTIQLKQGSDVKYSVNVSNADPIVAKIENIAAGTYDVTMPSNSFSNFYFFAAELTRVPMMGVALDITSKSMLTIDPVFQLTPTFTPATATDKRISWTTTDEDVVTVADGIVTPVGEGTATITVTTEDGGYTATCEVTVSEINCTSFDGTLYEMTAKEQATRYDIPVSAGESNEVALTADHVVYTRGAAAAFGVRGSSAKTPRITAKSGENLSAVDFNSGDVYVKIPLGCNLRPTDVITFTSNDDTKEFKLGNTPATVGTISTESLSYTVASGDALDGRNVLYVWKDNAGFVSVNVTRVPIVSIESVALSDLTIRTGKTNTPQMTVTPANGTILSAVWEIVSATGVTGSTIDAATGAVTAGTLDDPEQSGTITVKVTLNEDVDLSATCTVTVVDNIAQTNVDGSIVWDWRYTGATSSNQLSNKTDPKKNENFVLANVVTANANFATDKLVVEGEHLTRDYDKATPYFQGQLVSFRFAAATEGVVRITYSHTAGEMTEEKPAREIYINDVATGEIADNATFKASALIPVNASEVTITARNINSTASDDKQYLRIAKIEFYALDQVRSDSWIAPGELGTVCYPNGHIVVGADMYQMAGVNANGKFAFDQVEVTEPGVPYLFEATGYGPIKFYKTTAATVDEPGTSNGMVGTFVQMTLSPATDVNAYYFQGTHFYAVKDRTKDLTVPAYRCYVDLSEPHTAAAPLAGVRRITFGVNGMNTATGLDEISQEPIANSQKLLINGQIFILRGEKMYDVTGKLVK